MRRREILIIGELKCNKLSRKKWGVENLILGTHVEGNSANRQAEQRQLLGTTCMAVSQQTVYY